MNPQDIINLKNRMDSIEETLDKLEKTLNSIKLDTQYYLKSNNEIPPAIACKVAYDSKGLILSKEPLVEDDLPEISIDKIHGLRKLLKENNTQSTKEIKIDKPRAIHIEAGTGCKINYNENGLVTSSADLLPSDIPELSIDKITGLEDALSVTGDNILKEEWELITPGVGFKVRYNENGRVVDASTELTMNDIPIDIMNNVNLLNTKLQALSYAILESIDIISTKLGNKLDSKEDIKPGTFTKVSVDSKGLVVDGEKLSIEDLPSIKVSDIDGLESMLRKKADQSTVVDIMNNVGSMSDNFHPEDIAALKIQLQNKANVLDLANMESRVSIIDKNITNITNSLPSEFINQEMDIIKDKITVLEGQISTIIQKIK